MPYNRTMGSDGILVTTVSGSAGSRMNSEMVSDLPNHFPGDRIYELVVIDAGTEVKLEFNASFDSITEVRRILGRYRHGAIAFVSEQDVIFGLCRQLQMLFRFPGLSIQLRLLKCRYQQRLHRQVRGMSYSPGQASPVSQFLFSGQLHLESGSYQVY